MLRSSTALAAVLVSLCSAASAEITADDVWQMYVDLAGGLGGTLSAQSARDGNTVTYTNVDLGWSIPAIDLAFNVTIPSIALTEVGGAVSVVPQPQNHVIIDASVDGDGATIALMTVSEGLEMAFSGTPDHIVTSTRMTAMEITLAGISSTAPDFDGSGVVLSTKLNGMTQSADFVRDGEKLVLQDTTEVASVVGAYSGTGIDEMGTAFTSNFTQDNTRSVSNITLLAGGIDVMNLRDAFTRGLSIESEMSLGEMVSTGTTTVDGQSFDTAQSSQNTAQKLKVDLSGMQMSASSDQISFNYTLPDLGLIQSIPVTLGATKFALELPFGTQAAPGTIKSSLLIDSLAPGPEVWDFAAGMGMPDLPRDPISLGYDIEVDLQTNFDVLSPDGWASVEADPNAAFQLRGARVASANISGVGASATATADFTFDPDDMVTIPGMPRPQGTANIVTKGLDKLLDTLVKDGIVPEEEMMAVRLGMGMMLKADGEGGLVSDIEVTEDAQIIVNGQRLK